MSAGALGFVRDVGRVAEDHGHEGGEDEAGDGDDDEDVAPGGDDLKELGGDDGGEAEAEEGEGGLLESLVEAAAFGERGVGGGGEAGGAEGTFA